MFIYKDVDMGRRMIMIMLLLIVSSIVISGCVPQLNDNQYDLTTSTNVFTIFSTSSTLTTSIYTTVTGTQNVCRVPCTGAAPDPDVERDCYQLVSEEQCIAYKSDKFPYRCEWINIRTDFECPPYP